MFSSQEILEVLHSCPKGYLEPQHTFFTETNLKLLQTFKKLGSISKKDEIFYERNNSGFQNNIFCNAFGCSATFDNTASYQSHYNATHRFICEECKKSFPTYHFLDLHISENHDSYFKARLDRGELLFKCYLEECPEIFANSQDRKEHCLQQHRFPSNFRFDQKSRKGAFKKQSTSKEKVEQTKMEIDGQSNSTNNKSHKLESISFGKHKEKTFCPRSGSHKKRGAEKILDMNMLTQVLDKM